MRLEYGFSDLLLTSHAGLPAFSHLLKAARLPALFGPSLKTIPDTAIYTTQIALLALGKTDFEAVSAYRDDVVFRRLLRLKRLPSAEILRQRIDAAPAQLDKKFHEASLRILEAHGEPLANSHGFVPLDIDTCPMDNSGTKREGVAYTYKGFNGYHPLFAYLGEQGYMVSQQLRPGSQHAQKEFIPFFKTAVASARRLTELPLLARMDAANDSEETLEACLDEQVDFIARRNPRNQDPWETWNALGEDKVHFASGPGYYTALLDERRILSDGRSVRLITLVTQRTGHGDQLLLAPEYELQSLWTSLDLPAEEVLDLYQAHATCEQFHSELKSDIGLERFPSAKFATNAHILSFAQIAFNLLRLLGEQMKRNRPLLPKRLRELNQVRFRLRTVMQTLLYHAAVFTQHARRQILKLGRQTANSEWVLAVLRACPS
ncbi:MAG: IS1380 family transposase [SAR324 cluster bacterium]|nr:IS1380 family transposase [SAR324 cluster bacterium]